VGRPAVHRKRHDKLKGRPRQGTPRAGGTGMVPTSARVPLPWVMRRANMLLETRDLDGPAIDGLDFAEAFDVLACASLSAPHRKRKRP